MGQFLTINDLDGKDEFNIGGKARGLLWLTNNGFNVPRWSVCIVDSDEFEYLPKFEDWLGDKDYIVRSSALSEDGESASYAGQFESFGPLRERRAIYEAVRKCFRSQFSERIHSYEFSINKPEQEATGTSMGVVVQEMVSADISGVLFTANPTTGNRREFVISCASGSGEGVVSGQKECDEFLANPSTMDVKKISQLGKSGISRVLLNNLVKLGKEVTERRGAPQDIEWVVQGNTIYLVQVRPICNLPNDVSEMSGTVFDNSNIQESFNGVTLPLTFSYAVDVYHSVYRQTMSFFGFSEKEVRDHDLRHSQMLGLVKGRVYYNIRSWYEGLLLIPSFQRNKEDMEKMMGLETPVDFVEEKTLSFTEKMSLLPKVLGVVLRLSIEFLKLDRSVEKFRKFVGSEFANFSKKEFKWLDASSVLRQQRDLESRILGAWQVPIINDFYLMMMGGRVRRRLKALNAEDQLSSLIFSDDLDSVKPTKTLNLIAEKIRAKPKLVEALEFSNIDEMDQIFHKLDSEVHADICDYIDRFGDRVPGELKLETETFRTDRKMMYSLLMAYVLRPQLGNSLFASNGQDSRAAVELEILHNCKRKLGRITARRLKKDIQKLRKGISYRESMRLDRTRVFGISRSIYRELGLRLKNMGLLENQKDVFYLTTQEIENIFAHKVYFDSAKEVVSLRKTQYKAWKEEATASQVEATNLSQFRPRGVEEEVGADLSGIGCYPGIVEAPVEVMPEFPDLTADLSGKILVATRTDPGWTPLFPHIKGLIVEKGSQLSHSAVIARELGIPTIVNVPGITKRLTSGMTVRLNGESGKIEEVNSGSH